MRVLFVVIAVLLVAGISSLSSPAAPVQAATSTISLSPFNDVNPVGTDHTVTATVTTDVPVAGTPVSGVTVTFSVSLGPNAGLASPADGACSADATCKTDAAGQVSWTYTGAGGPGLDLIGASFIDAAGSVIAANSVEKIWINGDLPAGNRLCLNASVTKGVFQTAILDTENFGVTTVQVIAPALMCESAQKYREKPGELPKIDPATVEIEQCFSIIGGNKPNVKVRLTTENFGSHEVTVWQTKYLCESAVKQPLTSANPSPNGPIVGDPESEHVWQCWELRGIKEMDETVWAHTHDFGLDEVRVRRPRLLCEEAQKWTTAHPNGFGQATGRVEVCYDIAAKTAALPALVTTQNFGRQFQVLDRKVYLCESGLKERLDQQPN